MTPDSSETNQLLRRAAAGDRECWGTLLTRYEGRLRRTVTFRLDPRLQGRIDASDVMQEIFLAASNSLADYLSRPEMPVFLWLRGIAGNKLMELHRFHLGTPMRDARREVSLYRGSIPETESATLAARLLGKLTQPDDAAIRVEMKIRLQEALNVMDPIDREVLALRHFEHLSISEAAQVLDISRSATAKRYVRALERLRETLSGFPGVLEL